MRIIKAAKRADEYITTCINCGSHLGLTRNDLCSNNITDDDTNEDWRYYCEVCDHVNFINKQLNTLFPWILEDNDEQVQSNNTLRVNTL